MKYRARKTACAQGHIHASKKEAKRCDELHLLQRAGQIMALRVEQKFPLHANGRELKMGNGQVARYTADFSYIEGNRQCVEEVKGFVVRDFPLRWALFRACYPDIDARLIR